MRRDFLFGWISMLLAAVIFSTMEVMLKLPAVAGAFQPIQLTMERFVLGGLFLIPVAAWELRRRKVRLSGGDLAYFALTGLLNVTLGMVLYQMAITLGQANVVAVIFCGNPIFTTFLAWLILREAIHWNHVLALVFEVLGIFAILDWFGGTAVSLPSVGLTLLSALLFSLYSVLGKRRAGRVGSITVTCCSFLLGGLELFLLILLGYTGVGQTVYEAAGLGALFCEVPLFQGFSVQTLPYFLCIALINCAAGYVFHMLAIEKTSAAHASFIFFIKPMLAPLIALCVLGEPITTSMTHGILLFLAGSLLGILPELFRRRKQEHIKT